MKTLIYSLILIFTYSNAHAECFTTHVLEALEKNNERKPLYFAEAGDDSLEVSKALIASEKWALAYSRWMMLRTRNLRNNGIPIFCSEFTPMSLTPEFSTHFENGAPDINDFEPLPYQEIKRELNPHIRSLNLEMIKSISLRWALESYNEEPRFNCMMRHVLESIYATAEAAEANFSIAANNARLLRKTRKFTKKFLKSQVFGFFSIEDIDIKASVVQAQGVPIICNDVPAIIDLESF